jgi:hypothetical protein
MIFNIQLRAKHKIQATGMLEIPLRYSFGIINWHQEKVQKLDRKGNANHLVDSITQEQTLIVCMFPERR